MSGSAMPGSAPQPDDSDARHRRRTHDFDLHGIVGVRLVDATSEDVAKVARQLGPLDSPLRREPDVTIRFVDRASDKPLTYVGVGDCGFNEDGFFVLRGRGSVPGLARIAFEGIGRHPEIVCERTLPAVPDLLAIVNLTALAKGVLPLHASAFAVGGHSVLVTGWAKGGKTESLLAGMQKGGRYVGDEWVYLTPDQQMLGLPEPIRLWAWHWRQQHDLLRQRSWRDRTRLHLWRALADVGRAGAGSRLPGSGLLRRASPLVERQAFLQVPPTELFGAERVLLRAALESVVLVLSHSRPEITVEPAKGEEVAARMLASLAEERAAFMAHYRQYLFAFPDRANAVVETAASREADLLAAVFDGRLVTKVAHPYPCDIAALGRAVLSAVPGARVLRASEEEVHVGE